MSQLHKVLIQLHSMDELQRRREGMGSVHPLSKLFVTVAYLGLLMSIPSDHLAGIFLMAVYFLVLFILGDLSPVQALRRMRAVLPILLLVGIASLFTDRQILFSLGKWPITHGEIVFLGLVLKGLWLVFAVYLLAATTPMEGICYALRKIHVPEIMVTVVLLIYRYIFIMMEEAGRMLDAYHLRAPGQKGIAPGAWGSFVGNFLLRSFDRAQGVYESMCLRGYKGEFYVEMEYGHKVRDVFFAISWIAYFVLVRIFG